MSKPRIWTDIEITDYVQRFVSEFRSFVSLEDYNALEAQVRELGLKCGEYAVALNDAIKAQDAALAENKVLREALLKLRDDAFTCMEGADDPAFSDYERFCSVASQALKTKPAQGEA